MEVLQLGTENWADKYQVPDDITWSHNQYPPKKDQHYDLVIITLGAKLSDDLWKKLQWQVDPYRVLYLPLAEKDLSDAGKHFLICQEARQIVESPQDLIDQLIVCYFPGQSGMRIPPTKILLNSLASTLVDGGHLKVTVNSDEWVKVGNYQQNIYIDPDRLLKFSLEYTRNAKVKIRLRFFIQEGGGDGDPANSYLLDFSNDDEEQVLPLKVADIRRFANISIEVQGKGDLTIGMLHSRWSRAGKGDYFPGGQRLVDPVTGADIAYYFNPGDLKPPLHVYFSGARELEGFEAYPLFRRNHTPSLLFTDSRLAVGQFYTGEVMEEQIKATIIATLEKLGFNRQQLIMNGISMGTYPAIKLGAQLSPYAINVAKPTVNLGRVAMRARLQRPDEFDTIFDIDRQLVDELTVEQLTQLDADFWQLMAKNDLTKTRFYIGYMANDDYDDQAVPRMLDNSAIQQAKAFVSKAFAGRHNDDPSVVYWFISRLGEINADFGRGGK